MRQNHLPLAMASFISFLKSGTFSHLARASLEPSSLSQGARREQR